MKNFNLIKSTLVLAFLVMCNAYMWADFTVGFATSGTDVIASGGDYVSSSSTGGYTAIESSGIRFGSGSKSGSITITLTSSGSYVGQIRASKITLKDVVRYGTDASVTIKSTITYTDDTETIDSYTAPTSVEDHDIALTSTKTIKSITIESTASKKRFYCKGFTITAVSGSVSTKYTVV